MTLEIIFIPEFLWINQFPVDTTTDKGIFVCLHTLTDVLFFTPILNQAMSVKQRFLQRFSSQEEGHELRASGRIKKQKTVIK